MLTDAESLPTPARPCLSVRARLSDILFRAILALESHAERRRQRRALLALPDRMLKDIGLGRSEAERMAVMPNGLEARGRAVNLKRDA